MRAASALVIVLNETCVQIARACSELLGSGGFDALHVELWSEGEATKRKKITRKITPITPITVTDADYGDNADYGSITRLR